jgi:ATP-dependent protease ClpP protease subunit
MHVRRYDLKNNVECNELEQNVKNNLLLVKQTEENKIVDFYLINEIVDIADYIDFLRELDSCKNGDIVKIHINCYGGSVDVAWNLYDSIKSTDAEVQICVEGACCSCASMLMLSGDTWEISTHSYVMVHSWSAGIEGKYTELNSFFEYSKKYTNSQFKEIYKNFMNEQEIEDCLNGKDFYFDSNEVVKRIQNYQKDKVELNLGIQKISEKYSNLAEKEINKFMDKFSKRKG